MSIVKTYNYERIKSYIDEINMTAKSRTLLKYLFSRQRSNAAKALSSYSFLGTRDTTTILIVDGILACAGDDEIKRTTVTQPSISRLFRQMGRGNGSGAKKVVETKSFKQLLEHVFVDSGIDEKKIDKAVGKIITYVGKISKWVFSSSTVENYLMPIIKETLSDQIYTSFSTGFGTRKDASKNEDSIYNNPEIMVLEAQKKIGEQLKSEFKNCTLTAKASDEKSRDIVSLPQADVEIYCKVIATGTNRAMVDLHFPTEAVLKILRDFNGDIEKTAEKIYSCLDKKKIADIIKVEKQGFSEERSKELRKTNNEKAIPKMLDRIADSIQKTVQKQMADYIKSNIPELLSGAQIIVEINHYKNVGTLRPSKVLSQSPQVNLAGYKYLPIDDKEISFRIEFEEQYFKDRLMSAETPKEMGNREKELAKLLVDSINVKGNFSDIVQVIKEENKDYRERMYQKRNMVFEKLRNAGKYFEAMELERIGVDDGLNNEVLLRYEQMANN